MGLIDFVVNAGQKLLGGSGASAEAEVSRGAALAEIVKKLRFPRPRELC